MEAFAAHLRLVEKSARHKRHMVVHLHDLDWLAAETAPTPGRKERRPYSTRSTPLMTLQWPGNVHI